MNSIKSFIIIFSLLLVQLECFGQSISVQSNILKQESFSLGSNQPQEQKQQIKDYLAKNDIPAEKVRIVSNDRCQPQVLETDPSEELTPEEKAERERALLEQRRREDSIGANFNFSGGGSSDEFAIILIVIIGTIVVITWLASFPALLFKGLNDKECILFKQQFFMEYHDYNFDNYYQDGSSFGLQYSIYLKHMFENSIYYGLNFVFGQHDINYGSEYATINSKDQYFLIGPSLLFPLYGATNKNDQYGLAFNLDFLLGKSFSKAIDGMTQARFGLQYSHPNHLLFGFGIAGNKLNIESNDGYLKNNSDFSVSYYFKFGLEF